ncbi:UDP-N-acetylmuramoyl-tripeptide--D-alanyl-D-alanine ligase [Swingsia samuiensis]|uniref:UDP-N-acetylmuramoyl-tripeptide--D-alanyl-D-alanine ligase n=1 Tax=Swingsia samuiensis TaxID=1293412 RepID=A0A4Y6UFF1_9PROT|nr:UDP-N-acetylmuramoyl-tripeptide--D-alanyl-D-alanine ligase [Swingsia samuiensis]QDH16269.1 UDP-N-acetylmuramoyl-tripeptide--D-alanyl-D-alanine ligase [Swingsia samuiensis]
MNILWTSDELRQATHGKLVADDLMITGVSIDTRTLQPGDLFIALQGENSDGHAHIEKALQAGAACVMIHTLDISIKDDPRLLLVADTMQGLIALGHYARTRFKGKLIAITGSVGKTTTKDMLRTALQKSGKTHAAVASYNNHWGVPLTLARLPKDADYCISEIGMNHVGEILPLAQQVKPDVAIITTIGTAHLGHMGSIEAIAKEKASLFSALQPHGTAIVPDDAIGSHFFHEYIPHDRTLWTCGISSTADICIQNLVSTAEGSHFTLLVPQQKYDVELHAPGKHIARNAALVLGTVKALHADLPAAISALKTFLPSAGRGQIRTILNNVQLLDESYNASTTSVRAAIETLSLLPAQRHVVALGDILELGTFAAAEHRTLAESVISANAIAFCCGEHMRALYDALPKALQGAYAPDSRSLAPVLRAALQPGDLLLVKGSFGSRMRDLIALLDQTSNPVSN